MFNVGQIVLMQESVEPRLTIQFINGDVVTCSYVREGLIHTVDLNANLLWPAPEHDFEPEEEPEVQRNYLDEW